VLRLFLKTGTGVPCPYNFATSGYLEAFDMPQAPRFADGRVFGRSMLRPYAD